MKEPNKHTALALDQKVIAGVDKYYANATLALVGTSLTAAALKAVFQGDVDATNAVDSADAQYKQLVANMHSARAKASAMRQALRDYILATAGAQAVQMLQDFGMQVPKRPKNTPEAQAFAVAKRRATRQARHTMGKNQKATIHGTVTIEPAAGATPAAAPAANSSAPSK